VTTFEFPYLVKNCLLTLSCFNQENESGGHAWVVIGGDVPSGPTCQKNSFGLYPDGDLWGKPGIVQNHDNHYDDDDFKYERWATTPAEEKELKEWIKRKFDLNKPGSKKNPIFNLPISTCRDFSASVRNKLKEILGGNSLRGIRVKPTHGTVPKNP
jgi:hypothetical protein